MGHGRSEMSGQPRQRIVGRFGENQAGEAVICLSYHAVYHYVTSEC